MNLSNCDFHYDSKPEYGEYADNLAVCERSPRHSDMFKHRNSGELFLDILPKSVNGSFDLSDSFSLCELKMDKRVVLRGNQTPELKTLPPTTNPTPVKLEEQQQLPKPLYMLEKTAKLASMSLKSEISNNKPGCNCKKTKCLKLYCECFANGGVCSPTCKCENCHNTAELQDLRELIIQETLEKNPLAFKSKYKATTEKDKVLHSRGCRCSKAGCQKNYCECYSKGLGCSRLCRCDNCQNQKIDLKDEEVGMYYDRVLRKRKKPNYIYEFYFKKYFNLKNKMAKPN